ncbi:hypothetical protein Taro_022606 [Colocasia esculenta]|uniref:Uncharacterized protein n=1 Tax=Colocasia esculenta TaxID=4460 RepID=A0A843V1S7_COLES|nr:hypothetical protein [Colocasia esculenta]
MATIALIEIKSLRMVSTMANPLRTVPMSVFWLLDFFLRECPSEMKTMGMRLFLSTISLAFFLSLELVIVVHKVIGQGGHDAWLADNLNQGRLYNFYWLLAMVNALNLLIYLMANKWSDDKNNGVELKERHRDKPGNPLDSITVFFVAFILLTIPIYICLMVPVCHQFTSNPQGFTPLQCIDLGLVLFAFTMAKLSKLRKGIMIVE